MRPVKVLRRPRLVMVTKLVIMTSSLGIIISDRNTTNAAFLPRKFSRAKANAASIVTISIRAVVTSVNISVLVK